MASGGSLQISLEKSQVAEYLRDDLDYLATTLMPEEAIYAFPPFYKMVWALILQNLHTLTPSDIFRFALGLPRGNVKTCFLKLLVCYLLIHDYELPFILIVCSTEGRAENFLADVDNMMHTPVISQVYGSWAQAKTRNTMQTKQSNWQGRKLILVAIGAQTSIRGVVVDNKRPNLIICDDAQTKENDESPAERGSLLRWLVGTLFKARAKVEKSAILYIGNMYSTDCILYKFSKMQHWTSLVTGSILADGSILWPELNTLEELLEEYAHDNELGEGATWFAEVQNDPIGAALSLLDIGETVPLFAPKEVEYIDTFPIRFITVDPAGDKATSDDNVVATHVLLEEDKGATIKIANGKWNPSRVIQEIITQVIEYRVGIVFIESNAYQGTLGYWLRVAMERLDMDFTIIALPSGRASKFKRIKAWVKQFVHGKWSIEDLDSYNLVTFQLYGYRVNVSDNVDDCLDVCAQAILALSKHYDDIIHSVYLVADNDAYKDIPVMLNNSFLDRLR